MLGRMDLQFFCLFVADTLQGTPKNDKILVKLPEAVFSNLLHFYFDQALCSNLCQPLTSLKKNHIYLHSCPHLHSSNILQQPLLDLVLRETYQPLSRQEPLLASKGNPQPPLTASKITRHCSSISTNSSHF